METHGTATLTHEIPASHAVTAVVSREEIAGALQRPEPPELYLDLEFGEERSSIGIAWSHDELEQLLDRATGDDILFTFDRDQLQLAFDDVEAHGLRERALVFTVAVVGAIGSGATIANAAPYIGDNASGASMATVENLAAHSIGGVAANVHTPGAQIGDEATAATPSASVSAAKVADDAVVSNIHTPGVQLGDEGATSGASMASAAAIKLATEPQVAVGESSGVTSSIHTPGAQIGPEESASSAAAVKLSTEPQAVATDSAVMSNVHTPGLQLGPGESAGATRSVQVSAGSSSGEFLGIDTRDATEALLAGGVLLAIAGATFAGTRRPGSARPA